MSIVLRHLTPHRLTNLIPKNIVMAAEAPEGPKQNRYDAWTREQLIERLNQIDNRAQKFWTAPPVAKDKKPFDFSKYSRRKIALKFCYSGWEYGGLAFQPAPTPLPTVENVLYDALSRTRLVDPDGGFEACGWEKCGRTDRGVSAAGQVVSLWIRSALPPSELLSLTQSSGTPERVAQGPGGDEVLSLAVKENSSPPKGKGKPQKEYDYVAMLNRVLPDTIRILAWSPVSESFSARFSCTFRHYKYFFSGTNLDIPLMKAAADRLLGEHDFQNLCKVDAQKQITSFRRKILRATVTPLDATEGGAEGMHALDLVGTAFLYHQVRHIMAILFLVGSGLEQPSIVSQLLNTADDLESPHEDERYIALNRKPEYQMADALPLMLWDCGYDETQLDWRTSTRVDDDGGPSLAWSQLCYQLMDICNRSQVYLSLNRHFLNAATKYFPRPKSPSPLDNDTKYSEVARGEYERDKYISVPLGGGTFKRSKKYVPIMNRTRLDTVEAINERWLKGRELKLLKDSDGEKSGLQQIVAENT